MIILSFVLGISCVFSLFSNTNWMKKNKSLGSHSLVLFEVDSCGIVD